MPIIKIRNCKNEINFYNQTMTIYQALHNLNWIVQHKCIDCEQQCSDCYLDYIDKISIETLISHLRKNKKTIKKAVGINQYFQKINNKNNKEVFQ